MKDFQKIEVKNKLSNSSMLEFLQGLEPDSKISIFIRACDDVESLLETKVSELKEFFKKPCWDVLIISDEDDIAIISENKALIFGGKDFRYFTETVNGKKFKRLSSLFREKKESKSKSKIENEEESILIYSGILKDGRIDNLKVFEGNKKEVIDFMNKSYQLNEIICFFQNKSVFYLPESKENMDVNNLENWKTLQELKEGGIIEL